MNLRDFRIGWRLLVNEPDYSLAAAIERYLAGNVEHVAIGYRALLFALFMAFTIALIAVARHAWIAMHIHPIHVLIS
ncbi:hypothetical protein [Solimicrobium silvestre]|uniref:Uncharacterized protein n=1 Tax=Solimicrobium silvestre TaxID=2099400 RepID=A0A2S9H4P2_9BURK|nr:hypothetical protein [Solimicrobium silvestre]PRC94954.1 hypothetical protein S2091_0149 [Solimicrobium silvestre]